MSEEYRYILRHKLKNPTYEIDSNHQWFNIVDILQRKTNDENNLYENEIQLHGILKDDNSVSTNNIEDGAIKASKTNFIIYGNGIADTSKNENSLSIQSGSIGYNDLSLNAKTAINENLDLEGAVDTNAITSGAIIWDHFQNTGDNAIDWSNNLPKNTINQNGLVRAGNNNGSKVWATDDDGNPGWRKVSNQFDTKLFGAFISHDKPFSGEITISYTENFSTSFKSSTDYSEGVTGEGSVTFQYVLDIENNKIKLNLQEISFSPDDPTIQEYSWNIENHLDDDSYYKDYSYDFNEQSNIISLESFLYTYINFYLQGTDRYFNNIPYEDFIDDTNTSNSAIVNLWTYPLITYFDSYYKRNSNPIISVNGTNYNIELIHWENYTNSYLKNWDYNHCGIWIET